MPQIPDILGLPPEALISSTGGDKLDTIRKYAMPVATITPCNPKAEASIASFTLDESSGAAEYSSLLGGLGYSGKLPLKVAFQADSFPTDNFANSYAESFLDKTTKVVSQGISSMSQMFGAKGAIDLGAKMGGLMSDGNKGTALGTLGQTIQDKSKQLESFKNNNLGGPGMLGDVARTLDSVLAGARVDFPQIWTDSSYTPSYTMTIRLYNPNPSSEDDTNQYIIGPLAALLLLGLPRSKGSTATYNYPFLHKIHCPGIYFLNPCYISNISVIKGGDQQSIAWNQRLGIVDVRIDFGSLYSSIISQETPSHVDRPTLKAYLEAMRGSKYTGEKSSYDMKEINSTDFGSMVTGNWDHLSPIENINFGTMVPADRYHLAQQDISDSIISDMVGDMGSLKAVVEKTGYSVPFSWADDMFKNGKISLSDLSSLYPSEVLKGGVSKFMSSDIMNKNLVKLTMATITDKSASVIGSLGYGNRIMGGVITQVNHIKSFGTDLVNNMVASHSLLFDIGDGLDYINNLIPGDPMIRSISDIIHIKERMKQLVDQTTTAVASNLVSQVTDPLLQDLSIEIQQKLSITTKQAILTTKEQFGLMDDETIRLEKEYEEKVKTLNDYYLQKSIEDANKTYDVVV